MAKLNTLLEKNGIKELSSFSNTKEFKKRTSKDMIPNTFCSKYLVNKFREEAEKKVELYYFNDNYFRRTLWKGRQTKWRWLVLVIKKVKLVKRLSAKMLPIS